MMSKRAAVHDDARKVRDCEAGRIVIMLHLWIISNQDFPDASLKNVHKNLPCKFKFSDVN